MVRPAPRKLARFAIGRPAAGGLGLLLAGCAATGGGDAPGFAAVGSGDPFRALGSWSPTQWLDNSRRNLDAAIQDLRQGADGVWQATVSAAGGLTRSVSGRPIATMQACPMIDGIPDCVIGARIACAREGYRDGLALTSVRYESCRGLASVSLAAGACRTKQRLQSALCW
jgi:hypothetical protein